MTPRDYQSRAGREMACLAQGGTSEMLLAMGTGLGKTNVAAWMDSFVPREGPTLFLVHREELALQAVRRFNELRPGSIVQTEMGSQHAYRVADVVVASVQTLGHKNSHRIEKFEHFKTVIVDEAHHCLKGSQYERVLDHFGCGPSERDGDVLLVGLTATPNRHDGRGLHQFFSDIVPRAEAQPPEKGWDLAWGISAGWLVPIRNYVEQTETNLDSVTTTAGDFTKGKLAEAIDTDARNEQIVRAYRDKGSGKALAFCPTIAHAKHLEMMFTAHGVHARCVHSNTRQFEMDPVERHSIISQFRRALLGSDTVLVNVGIATEGFDIPDLRMLLLARPTRSLPFYMQMLGRGPRPAQPPTAENPEARAEEIARSEKPEIIVIDFVDLTSRHAAHLQTAPRLFGLAPKFACGELHLNKAADYVDALEKENPLRPVRRARSLEEVEIMLKEVSLWDVAKPSEKLQYCSELKWVELGDGIIRLTVPASCMETPQADFSLRLEADRLGRYSVTRYVCPLIQQGVLQENARTTRSMTEYDSVEEALQGCDAYLKQQYGDLLPLLLRNQRWQKKKASSKQTQLLSKLGVYIPEDYDLMRGQASSLIDAKLAEQRGL